MSSNTTQLSSFIQQQSDWQLYNYVVIAGAVIGVYDTFLTISQEVRFVWTGTFRGITILYVVARFSVFLSQILYAVIEMVTTSENACYVQLKVAFSVYLVAKVSISGILLARVYALMHSQRYLFVCLGMVFLSCSVLAVGNVVLARCKTMSLRRIIVLNAESAFDLLYDAFIFGVTVYHTWRIVRLRRSLPDMTGGTSLASIILEQGIIRFGIILFWAIQLLITEMFVQVPIGDLMVPIQRSVTYLLVLRFFLDLRERNAHLNGTSRTRDLAPLSSFKVAARSISNAIIEGLGDPKDEALFVNRASDENVSGPALHPSANDAENNDSSANEADNNDSSPTVNLVEFPWAAGDLDQRAGIQSNSTV